MGRVAAQPAPHCVVATAAGRPQGHPRRQRVHRVGQAPARLARRPAGAPEARRVEHVEHVEDYQACAR